MPLSPVRSISGTSVDRRRRMATARALPEEEAVAIVCNGTTQAVMMATPQDLHDLAAGFALTEGYVAGVAEIQGFEVVEHPQGLEARLWIDAARAEALGARRRAMAGPVGCGLCGIESLAEAARDLPRVATPALRLSHEDVAGATEALRRHQPMHDQTRAVHAAGFLRPGEGIVMAREDVGRHNALDKLIGALARAGIDPAAGAFVLTSRVSVEMVQKCAMAGCPVLVAVSAPTAHAVRLAEGAGITLAAFARGSGYDLFTHPGRIAGGEADVA